MDGWMDGEYAEVCSDLEQQALELKQNRALIDSINSSTKVCICVLQLHHIKADEHDKIDIHNGCRKLIMLQLPHIVSSSPCVYGGLGLAAPSRGRTKQHKCAPHAGPLLSIPTS